MDVTSPTNVSRLDEPDEVVERFTRSFETAKVIQENSPLKRPFGPEIGVASSVNDVLGVIHDGQRCFELPRGGLSASANEPELDMGPGGQSVIPEPQLRFAGAEQVIAVLQITSR
jgi:hypothetical protein